MEHFLKQSIGNQTQEIKISEDKISKDYEQVYFEITNYENEEITDRSFFIFSEKQKLHSFIGLLLHIQSKMK